MTTREKTEYYLLSFPISVLKSLTLIWDGLYPHSCCLSSQSIYLYISKLQNPGENNLTFTKKKKHSTLTAYNVSSKLNKYDKGPG